MRTPARILRNTASRHDTRRDRLSDKEQEQKTRILDLGQALMATHGRHTMTMAAFALAIGHSPGLIRKHFPDLDSLLAHILHRHLRHIATALGDAARTRPDDQPALRKAYAAATRTGLGALTEPHLLLTRDRHLLPEDELDLLERSRNSLGETIAGELGRQAMLLLDEPSFEPETVERMLATVHDAAAAALAAPPDAAGPLPRSPAQCASEPPQWTTRPPSAPLLHLDQIGCRWPRTQESRAGPRCAEA